MSNTPHHPSLNDYLDAKGDNAREQEAAGFFPKQSLPKPRPSACASSDGDSLSEATEAHTGPMGPSEGNVAQTFDDLPPLLTVREAARLMGISHTVAYKMDGRGELPTFGTGARRVVTARLLALLGVDVAADRYEQALERIASAPDGIGGHGRELRRIAREALDE